jgi:UDP-glucose 4-epimerase
MQVLVTGATGAVGPVVVEALVAAGMGVRALVRTPPPPGLLPPPVTLVQGDITVPATLDAAVAGCDGVVHLAALLHINNPAPALAAQYEAINVFGTLNLLAAAQRYGVARFVLMSTIAVYGKGNQPPDSPPLDEQSPPQPDTLYGQTKLRAEAAVLAARTAAGQPLGVVLRAAAVYGARVKGNYQRLYDGLARGRFVPIGPGANRRTLIYDRDLATAVALALTHPAAAGRIYNVTDGEYPALHQIIAAICRAQGRPQPRLRLPLGPLAIGIALIEDLCGVAGRTAPVGRAMLVKYTEEIRVDGQRLMRELDFQPTMSLVQGWQAVANAYASHNRSANR